MRARNGYYQQGTLPALSFIQLGNKLTAGEYLFGLEENLAKAKSDVESYAKSIEELKVHPKTGTGKPFTKQKLL